MTLGELVHGVEKPDNQQYNLESLEGFAGRLEVINYDEAAAYHFGQLTNKVAEVIKSLPLRSKDSIIYKSLTQVFPFLTALLLAACVH